MMIGAKGAKKVKTLGVLRLLSWAMARMLEEFKRLLPMTPRQRPLYLIPQPKRP